MRDKHLRLSHAMQFPEPLALVAHVTGALMILSEDVLGNVPITVIRDSIYILGLIFQNFIRARCHTLTPARTKQTKSQGL